MVNMSVSRSSSQKPSMEKRPMKRSIAGQGFRVWVLGSEALHGEEAHEEVDRWLRV